MVSTLLMLERALCDHDANTDDHDAEIVNNCRRTVREILEDAELRLWESEDAGWRVPDDDSALAYAARLLFFTARSDELMRAVSLAREITCHCSDGLSP